MIIEKHGLPTIHRGWLPHLALVVEVLQLYAYGCHGSNRTTAITAVNLAVPALQLSTSKRVIRLRFTYTYGVWLYFRTF